MANVPHSRPWIRQTDIDAVSSQLQELQVSHGSLSETFASELAQYVGVRSCVTANSGTQGLVKAVSALHLSYGAKVLIPAYVCQQVEDAVLAAGCEPVVSDVSEMGVLDPTLVERALSAGIKAVVAVHVFGHPCDIDGIRQIGLPVIEDACQALGLRIGERMAGSLGTVAVFSTHATKCITSGEGGAVATSDSELSSVLHRMTKYAKKPALVGNLSDLGASLALSQLRHYETFVARRQNIDRFYRETAASLGLEVGGPSEREFVFRFTVRLSTDLEKSLQRLWSAGICARRGVDSLLRGQQPTPQAETLFASTLSLPIHPSLTDSEVERVADAMKLLKHD